MQDFPLKKKKGRVRVGGRQGSEKNLIPKSRVPGGAKRVRQGTVGREPHMGRTVLTLSLLSSASVVVTEAHAAGRVTVPVT